MSAAMSNTTKIQGSVGRKMGRYFALTPRQTAKVIPRWNKIHEITGDKHIYLTFIISSIVQGEGELFEPGKQKQEKQWFSKTQRQEQTWNRKAWEGGKKREKNCKLWSKTTLRMFSLKPFLIMSQRGNHAEKSEIRLVNFMGVTRHSSFFFFF